MFKNLTLFGLVLAVSLIISGIWLRATQAGLGCPDWPLCYGQVVVHVPPVGEALPQFPGVPPFEAAKAWKAMSHRYLALGLGVFGVILAGLVFTLKANRGKAVALAYGFLTLLAGQMVLGYFTVTTRLLPQAVTAHLLMGLLSLAVLYALYFTVARPSPPLQKTPLLRGLSGLGVVLMLVQLASGGWASSHHAGLACPDFPTCLGQIWPDADYAEGFDLLRGLQGEVAPEPLSQSAKVAIHWVHRLGTVPVFLVLSVLAMMASSNRRVPGLSKAGLFLSLLLLAEVSLGVAGLHFRWLPYLVLAHSAVAVFLWLDVVHIFLYLRLPLVEIQPEAKLKPVAPPIEETLIGDVIAVPEEVPLLPSSEGLFLRLKGQLGRTRNGITGFLSGLVGRNTLDADALEDVETQLIMADVGVTVTRQIMTYLKEGDSTTQEQGSLSPEQRIRAYLHGVLEPVSSPLVISPETRPYVILVVGVNGVGKTTTIGKLAKRLQMQGHRVMLAAGDTFRAAAVEQLQTWGERNQVPVIAQQSGADSASVIYDALQAAQARGVDVLIADTAGRLHTKSNLMEELAKIRRVIARTDETAPHEVLLVLDASTGQNALSQARQFHESVNLTGIVLTKLDGTAKGGVIFALAQQFGIPIRFIGIGENIDDLQDFSADRFIDALFADTEHSA
ncbi:MAG: signal recognition particle-docking protein FtsY [Methylococcaceae bacterium]